MSSAQDPAEIPGADACANYLKALADPHRLQIIRALQQGAMSVSDIALLLELEIANASHHLRVLYHAQIVKTHKDGKFVYYEVNPAFLKSKAASSFDFGCCQFDLRNLE
ncbi:ArsR/SmtB family transcription factor [Blastopirellula retiformator]|uniref:Transcriptional repressor SdpR n=1 Tax=Blastopirellula retiformator TaxID=2527970 RepID=A0A5C5V9L0_9BACT|nr:metalloregulator ArsR/SmtB family transcription factor [Blastopirellula retiformator]TWT34557.1 Transcriptional repressor SdpR [Blastopirellula retiformator]